LQEDNTAVTQKTWISIPAAKDQRLNASNTAHSNMSPASLRGGFQDGVRGEVNLPSGGSKVRKKGRKKKGRKKGELQPIAPGERK
jgi:hypothetical protein